MNRLQKESLMGLTVLEAVKSSKLQPSARTEAQGAVYYRLLAATKFVTLEDPRYAESSGPLPAPGVAGAEFPENPSGLLRCHRYGSMRLGSPHRDGGKKRLSLGRSPLHPR